MQPLRHLSPAVAVAAGRPPVLSRLDRLGILVSSLCLVHCLLLPVVIAMLPALAGALPPDIWVHLLLIGAAVPVTGFTLARGYRAHRNPRPALLGLFGLGLVSWALLAVHPVAGAALTVVGGALVAGAHVLNLRDHGLGCTDDHHGH